MSKKYMMIITHCTDNPHRANTAIGLATSLLVEGADVSLFFMCEGAKLVQKGVAENPRMYVCKIDLKNLGIDESELLDGVEIATLPTIASHMLKRETLMC
jgi:predicted peroxiredoxin